MLYRLLLTLSLSLKLCGSETAPVDRGVPPSPAYGTSPLQHPEPEPHTPAQPSARETTDSHAETDRKTSSARGAITPLPGASLPGAVLEYEVTPAPSAWTDLDPAEYYQDTRRKLLAAQQTLLAAQNDQAYDAEVKKGLNDLFITAAGRGYVDLVELAISAGADINAQSMRGYTAIHGAIERLPHPNLIMATQGIHERNPAQDTSGLHSVIRILLAHHADLFIPTKLGVTPLQTAINQQQIEVIYLFAKAGQVQITSLPQQQVARGRLARRESFDVFTPIGTVDYPIEQAAILGVHARRADEQIWSQQTAVIAAAIPQLPIDLMPIIQKYAGLPPVSFDAVQIIKQTNDAVEIIKQTHQPGNTNKRCCTVS